MVITTRGIAAKMSNISDDSVGPEESTVTKSVPGDVVGDESVAAVSTGTACVPVVDSTLATMPPEDKNATVSASKEAAAAVFGDESVLGYLHLVGSLKKNVSRSDDQSAALSSSNVSVQHRKRAVDVENSFVQGLSAIGESFV